MPIEKELYEFSNLWFYSRIVENLSNSFPINSEIPTFLSGNYNHFPVASKFLTQNF